MAFAPALFIAGAGAKVGSGLLKADAAYKAGRQQKRQAMTEADMVEQATIQSDMEAREQIRRQRTADRAFTGSQRAAVAQAGVVGTTGSPIDILGRTAALQELQIQDQARRASTEYTSGFARARQIRVAGKAALDAGKRASYGQWLSTGAGLVGSIAGGIDKGILKFGSQRSLVPA